MKKTAGEIQAELTTLGFPDANVSNIDGTWTVQPWNEDAQAALDLIPKEKPKLKARETLQSAFQNEQDVYKRNMVWESLLGQMILDYVERKPEALEIVTAQTGITFDEYNVYEE